MNNATTSLPTQRLSSPEKWFRRMSQRCHPLARLALFFIAGLSLLSPGHVAQAMQTPTRLMEDAIRARSQGNMDDAIQSLDEAARTATKKEQKILALLMLGDCLQHAGNPDRALRTYQELIDQKPFPEEEAEARFRQAQCHLMLGRAQKTREICRDLKKRFPETEFARLAGHLIKSSNAPVSIAPRADENEAVASSEASSDSVNEVYTEARVEPQPRKIRTAKEPATPKAITGKKKRNMVAAPEVSEPEPKPAKGPYVLTNKDLEAMAANSTVAHHDSESDPKEDKGTQEDLEGKEVKASDDGSEKPESTADDEQKPEARPAPEKTDDTPDEPMVAKSGKFQEVDDISAALEQVNKPAKRPPRQESASSAAVRQSPGKRSAGTDSSLSGDVADLLSFPELSKEESEAMATEILKDQEEIQMRSGGTPDAELLFRLAGNTAKFGETKEACRLYDQLLRLHPASRFVEEAYFEAIRLRVILKAYKAAQDWGAIFLKSFPRSSRREAMQQLLEHATRAAGKKPARSSKTMAEPAPADTLSRDPHYREGARLRQEGRYALALEHFQRLTTKFSDQARFWHELALLEIQMRLYPEAEKHLKKLLEIEPNHGEGQSLLGYIHFQRRDYEKAAGNYQQARETTGKKAVPKEGLTFFDSESAARRLHQADRRKGDEP